MSGNIIEVRSLRKNYKNVEAVKEIGFTVKEGSFFALLGENGAGKTTTIQILSTLLRKSSGEVMINHHRIDQEDEAIRQDIGVVFQGNMLDPFLTVGENLISRGLLYGIPKEEIRRTMLELSEKIGVMDILDRPYSKLSGGQKRRADIVRALINKPRLLILDEPTTGLDPYARRCVWEVIRQLNREKQLTILLTTHYMEEAACADDIVIMDSGEIKACGTPEQLRLQYSSDRLLLIPKEQEEMEQQLDQLGVTFRKEKEHFMIDLKTAFDALDIVRRLRDMTDSFEVLRGSMEDVFLNVIGHDDKERSVLEYE